MAPGKWIWPMILVSVFIFTLSARQLSDPDLGFHLKYGKWIVLNERVPFTDLSTFTVSHHAYIDLHWLFQVVLYGVFSFTGYQGISVFICLLALFLSLMLLLRLRFLKIPPYFACFALLIAFLIIDPRIAPRPEMFTFLFLSVTLLVLDCYFEQRKGKLCLLPVIMLLWCNMHALFILGLAVMTVYFISILIRDRKPDKTLLLWLTGSFLVCFINPYGVAGFTLPIELLTRFDPDNIYNQHIQEFMPFFNQPHFVIRDYLFIGLLGVTGAMTFLTIDKRKPHELILLALFGFLAVGSVRNIPLFVLVSIPIICRQAVELSGNVRFWRKKFGLTMFFMMILFPLALIPRLLTNSWYISNNSFNKTGFGLNSSHLPVQAATFLSDNHLNGRILNSIGFGGWLSWAIPQPVFIDGRLEVMQESIYKEVTESWHGEMARLIQKYQPQLIIYNYLKYYPWTLQLREMSGWRLIYADGLAAIFASNSYAREIPEIPLSKLSSTDDLKTHKDLNSWFQGFYRQTDYTSIDELHQALFRLQMHSANSDQSEVKKSVSFFNTANLKYNQGDLRGALADYDTAIMLQPDYPKAYNNRGILKASGLHDLSGAIADFDKAIDLEPKYSDAYIGRGSVFYMLHNDKAAFKDWMYANSLGNIQAGKLIELHRNR